jgi:hypothetical protein
MFGSGAGGSTTFSLSKGKELVKSQERRGKARGRGRVRPAKPPEVGGASDTAVQSRYPAPKPGSGGITVIKPLDENSDPPPTSEGTSLESTGQFVDNTVATVPDDVVGERPGLPLRGSNGSARGAESLPTEAGLVEGVEEVAISEGGVVKSEPPPPQEVGGAGGVAPQQQEVVVSSKPKRYSSQRQKTTGSLMYHVMVACNNRDIFIATVRLRQLGCPHHIN